MTYFPLASTTLASGGRSFRSRPTFLWNENGTWGFREWDLGVQRMGCGGSENGTWGVQRMEHGGSENGTWGFREWNVGFQGIGLESDKKN